MINENFVASLIEKYRGEFTDLNNKRAAIITERAAIINEVIKKKIEELSESLKEDAIREVCQEEFERIDREIEITQVKLDTLYTIVEQPKEETSEEESEE